GDLRIPPAGVMHAATGARRPRLIAAAVQHHGGRGRRLAVLAPQTALAERLHLGVARRDPLRADALAEPLEVRRADRHPGQLAQVLAGVLERGGPAGLADRLLQ